MKISGMVHALAEIQRLLKPSGTLVDIHPVPEGYYIEARQGEQVLYSERRRLNLSEDVLEAEKALAQVVKEMRFKLVTKTEFNMLTYASSVAELRAYWAEQNAYNDGPKDAEVVAREEELFARVEEIIKGSAGEAEAATNEKARIALLKPIKPQSE
ncbi:MAG: hypothetical protein N2D54_13195 [Chloroflexota bacterium]